MVGPVDAGPVQSDTRALPRCATVERLVSAVAEPGLRRPFFWIFLETSRLLRPSDVTRS
jgi:hypothetical protein